VDDRYATIRDPDLLGRLIGAKCVDVTQQDAEDFDEDGESFVVLHFDNGYAVTFPIGDEPFIIQNCDKEDDDGGRSAAPASDPGDS